MSERRAALGKRLMRGRGARSLTATVGILTLLAYIFAAGHHITAEITAPQLEGSYAAAVEYDSEGQPPRAAAADMHCHECFSVSFSAPALGVVVAILSGQPIRPPLDAIPSGLPAAVDPPPPRSA